MIKTTFTPLFGQLSDFGPTAPSGSGDLGHGMRWLGIEWIGINAENGHKLLVTIAFIVVVSLLMFALRRLTTLMIGGKRWIRIAFWTRQTVNVTGAIVLTVGVLSIWFDDPQRLATAFGLVAAGLAFALQKVVTAIAGYFVILRGQVFKIGDRIEMGGIRGDVIDLRFTQTVIMEMGQSANVQEMAPGVWVRGRQYTGRLVSITNAKIFDEPVFNYSAQFRYIWEEMTIPIAYQADRKKAEWVLLEAARKHAPPLDHVTEKDLAALHRRYPLEATSMEPTVYFRLTDNWLELSLRFVTSEYGARVVKDAISREIIERFDEAGIGVASSTFEIVGMPEVRVQLPNQPA